MKRVMPAPMGRAFRVRKRSNHITIVVAQREEAKKEKLKVKASADVKKTKTKKPVKSTKEATES